MKHWLFKFYPWVAVIAFAVGATIIFRFVSNGRVGSIGTLIAGILGFCYFVQQQKLSETELLKELFTDFNTRYDKLNDDLRHIHSTAISNDKDRDTVVDYFNLCAEEYLFFSLGYILPQVWTAWCRGMKFYLDSPHIAKLWRDELKTDSYYGLSEDVINKGAA